MSNINRSLSSSVSSIRKKINSSLSAVSILIIDSDALLPKVTRNVLESFGFKKIYHAKSAPIAMRILESKKIDLVISEWPMELKHKTNIVRHIRHQNKPYRRVPIILLTARGDARTVKNARNDGITEFLVKPFRVNTLCDRITRVVEQPREFVISGSFSGPDRRRKVLTVPQERREDQTALKNQITRKGAARIIKSIKRTVIITDKDFSIKEKIGFESKLSDIFTEEAMLAAEEIINQSSDMFLDEASMTVKSLARYFDTLQTDRENPELLHNLTWCALDMKAKSGVFGFSLASHIAKSLHDYSDSIASISDNHLAVMKEHIDALKVIFHQKLKISAQTDALAGELLSYLQKLTQRYPA